VKVEIRKEWPPNIAKIRAVLPVTERNIFAYDRVIYNPGGGELTMPLIEHEKVHFRQQGRFVRWWWWRFLRDPAFRLDQELEAHRAEYRAFCDWVQDRNQRATYLRGIARRLSSPMYGGDISQRDAMVEISR
jgi:hypothetical protein